MIIAIDGPAAAGKGTLARRLAAHFALAYLDTGLLYRAVARKLLDAGGEANDATAAAAIARGLVPADLEQAGLRQPEVSDAASKVAAIEGVRAALLAFQRSFAHHPPRGAMGAVLDGRDIGTVVCPDATVKLFLTATPEVRARRRHTELLGEGVESIYARVFVEVRGRDERDSQRGIAPLVPAQDAVELDTTGLDADAVFARALALIGCRLSAHGD
ncbi:MAG: (d)CMP kinase [Alphaproteobacteria bacterium]|nr:(d)CMP kinase [Alphaproteobacteria bacterium]